MDKPFFSVIVPTHNSEEYVLNCLRSVKMQTFKSYELIVVCDACTDSTHWWVESFADKVIDTDFGMDGMARNAGIDAAEGKWLLFLDDDDWWIHEYVLDEIYKKIMLRPDPDSVDMIIFDFIWKGRGYYHNRGNRMNIAVWTKAFRREFVGGTRFPAIPFTSDVNFMDDILQKMPRCEKLDDLMYYYNYMREGSQTEEHARGGDA